MITIANYREEDEEEERKDTKESGLFYSVSENLQNRTLSIAVLNPLQNTSMHDRDSYHCRSNKKKQKETVERQTLLSLPLSPSNSLFRSEVLHVCTCICG
jgi:hypothetical protein